jgi:hypothetical protein
MLRRYEFAVGVAGGIEFVGALFQLQVEIAYLLFECGDPLVELVDVGGRADTGLAPGRLGERRMNSARGLLQIAEPSMINTIFGTQCVDESRCATTR